MYAQKIEGDSWRGEKIDKGKIDKMSGMDLALPALVVERKLRPFLDQQLGQLYELMQAIKKSSKEGGDDSESR